ncbi:VOC family protein [Alphaproteobacteria bacterium]|nr:VOC family protein [Alphaproteobacteria bacterium]
MRHTGIVVENLKVMAEFYGLLGFTSQSQASEHGPFIEQVTGLKNVNLLWIKMNAPDGSVLELLKYETPNEIREKIEQPSNQQGVSHMAFTVHDLDRFCDQVVQLGGSLVNLPALTKNQQFRVVYCHDVEGNLFEAVEIQ